MRGNWEEEEEKETHIQIYVKRDACDNENENNEIYETENDDQVNLNEVEEWEGEENRR